MPHTYALLLIPASRKFMIINGDNIEGFTPKDLAKICRDGAHLFDAKYKDNQYIPQYPEVVKYLPELNNNKIELQEFISKSFKGATLQFFKDKYAN